MPATPSRIGFITQQFRVATAGPDNGVETLYGNAARDTPEPLETFFDSVADAQIMADERMALLSVQRSLVSVSIDGADVGADLNQNIAGSAALLLETGSSILLESGSLLLLESSGEVALATVRIIDDEQDRNSLGIIVGVSVDQAAGRTTLQVWG
jgi:hypothetical protein